MPAIAKLDWRELIPATEFSSASELMKALRDISRSTTRDNGIAALLEKQGGQTLTIIVAGDFWFLNWFPENYHEHSTGSYHTIGISDEHLDLSQDLEVATYFLHGHHGEVPVAWAISEVEAFDGITSFLEASSLPDKLRWALD
jgi:hypothetical protein